MWKRLLLVLVLAAVPLAAKAVPERLFLSFTKFTTFSDVYQPFRCVNGLAPGSATPAAGEDCEAGDWSAIIPAGSAGTLKVWWRVESGTGIISVWECVPFYGGTLANDNPRPSLTDTGAGNTPLCANLTAGAGISFDGQPTGTQFFSLTRTGGTFGAIVIELDTEVTLTGNMRVELSN